MVYTNGIPNLAQVDNNVWRSGQIASSEGWQTLSTIASGRHLHVIKLNFANEGSDDAAKLTIPNVDLIYLPMQPQGDQDVWDDLKGLFVRPDAEQLAKIEAVLDRYAGSSTDIVIVHCTHGQDRTGFVIGRYRVLHDKLTKAAAYDEMIGHHFHAAIHGLHEAWEDWIPLNGSSTSSAP